MGPACVVTRHVRRNNHVTNSGASPTLIRTKVAVIFFEQGGSGVSDCVGGGCAAVTTGYALAVRSPALAPFFRAVESLTQSRACEGCQACTWREGKRCEVFEPLFFGNFAPRFWSWLGQQTEIGRQTSSIEGWIGSLSGTEKRNH